VDSCEHRMRFLLALQAGALILLQRYVLQLPLFYFYGLAALLLAVSTFRLHRGCRGCAA